MGFQASATKCMKTALFWVITRRIVAVSYWCFGKPIGPIFKVQGPKQNPFWILDPIGCPETPVRSYRFWLRSNPEERSFQVDWPSYLHIFTGIRLR